MGSKHFTVWGDLLTMAMIFFAATLVGAVCLVAIKSTAPETDPHLLNLAVYAVQFALAIAGGCVWYGRRKDEKPLLRFEFNWFSAPLTLLGILLTAAVGIVTEPLLSLFPDHYFESIGEAIGSGGVAILFCVVIAPICEEIFFRGLVLEHLSRRWSVPGAVATSAIFFGLVHLPNLPQALNAFVIAVVMGYIYMSTRSLVPVIVIHAINNGLAYLQLQMSDGSFYHTRETIGNDALYMIVYGASVAVLIASILLMALRKHNNAGKKSLQENNA